VGCVRGDRHRRQHAHRVVVGVPGHVPRRAVPRRRRPHLRRCGEAFVDWLCSGTLERFADLRIVFSEGQIGWMPFMLDRLDSIWVKARGFGGVRERVPRPPSTYVPGRVFGCVFDDPVGLALREQVGMDQIMFETDYPHSDSTWPESKHTAMLMVEKAGMSAEETDKLLRANAISCYRLDRYGIER